MFEVRPKGRGGGVNLIGLVDIHTYLGATHGELSFSMGVLPGASGFFFF